MSRIGEISIWDAETRAVLVQALPVTLPVEIGRSGPDGVGRVLDAAHRETRFGKDMQAMSREHMRIVPDTDGGVTVIDLSTNGVARLVPGQPPMHLGRNRQEQMPAGVMRQFQTVGLIIEIALPKLTRMAPSARLFATYYSNSAKRERAVDLHQGCIAMVQVGDGLQMERQAATSISQAVLSASSGEVLAILGPGDDGRVVIRPTRADAVVCNRRALKADAEHVVEHLDTIEMGALTLRILAEGAGDVLVCINPECGQMNAHNPGGNCRYCGTRLGDAVTRMLPTEGDA